MAKHSPNQSLADIYTNIDAARRYLAGVQLDGFKANEEKQLAVLYRLQSASEAATRLRNQWPNDMIASLRHTPRYPSSAFAVSAIVSTRI